MGVSITFLEKYFLKSAKKTQNKYTTAILQGGKPVNLTLTPTFNFIDGNNNNIFINEKIVTLLNYTLKFSFEYPITAQAILLPEFPVFKLSLFPPFPQSSSSS